MLWTSDFFVLDFYNRKWRRRHWSWRSQWLGEMAQRSEGIVIITWSLPHHCYESTLCETSSLCTRHVLPALLRRKSNISENLSLEKTRSLFFAIKADLTGAGSNITGRGQSLQLEIDGDGCTSCTVFFFSSLSLSQRTLHSGGSITFNQCSISCFWLLLIRSALQLTSAHMRFTL